MITHISIKDFAIIEDLNIEFNDGLNIITGETGSGKSIIIHAISLAFGARADSTYIRTGKDKARVQVVIDTDEENYILYREISVKGKSLCKINDEIVTVAALSDFSKKFVDIHGQYDNQYLLHPENHLNILDGFGDNEHLKLKNTVHETYLKYVDVRSRMRKLLAQQSTFNSNLEFMKFQLSEIEAISPKVGELEELQSKISLLKNSKEITDNLYTVHNKINGDDNSILNSLSEAMRAAEELSKHVMDFDSIKAVLEDCYYSLSDISSDIIKKMDGISYNYNDIDSCIERYESINSLVKKYGSIEKSLEMMKNIQTEIVKNESFDDDIKKLKTTRVSLQNALIDSSNALSEKRKEISGILMKRINEELSELGFKNINFFISFNDAEKTVYTDSGMDRPEFMISTNMGEDLKPIAKIASGGEISRIMLAFKSVLSDTDNVNSMIFDEIDTGISGIAANTVGNKLKRLASNRQIICITHLPQIAAKGDYHYKIIKEVSDGHTGINISLLSDDERIDEIARFLGGENITDTTRSNARELLDQKNNA